MDNNNLDNSRIVQILIDTNKSIYDMISYCQYQIDELYGIINNNKKEIYEQCDHNWISDLTSCEPCGPIPKICTKCSLYKGHC